MSSPTPASRSTERTRAAATTGDRPRPARPSTAAPGDGRRRRRPDAAAAAAAAGGTRPAPAAPRGAADERRTPRPTTCPSAPVGGTADAGGGRRPRAVAAQAADRRHAGPAPRRRRGAASAGDRPAGAGAARWAGPRRRRRSRPTRRGRRRARRGDHASAGAAASARAGPSAATSCACTCAPDATQIAVLEGRALIEHYVSRPQDDVSQIDGNIYLGRVQNVLPGMEAAFVDIGTPKNAVLYRGDVQYDPEDLDERRPRAARIEQLLRPGPDRSSARSPRTRSAPRAPASPRRCRCRAASSCSCPTATPTASPSACADDERKRLRRILDDVKPDQPRPHRAHRGRGRHAPTSCGATSPLLEQQWEPDRGARPSASKAPALLYREPDLAVRVIREEFNATYRGVVIDDRDAVRGGARLRREHQPRAGRPRRVLRPGRRARCRSSSASTSTSRSTRRSTARCGCRRAAR